MTKCLYLYNLDYYDSMCGNTESINGIIQAHSFGESVEQISNYYGEDNIEKLTITVFDVPMFTFDDEELEVITAILNK